MVRFLPTLLFAPFVLAAQTTSNAPWTVALSGADKLGNGECRSVQIDLKDSTGKEWPRRGDGRWVTLADFDMAVTPGSGAVGKYNGASDFQVCACPGATAGAASVTATYPARQQPAAARIPGVSFTASMSAALTGVTVNSNVAPGCPSATKTLISSGGATLLPPSLAQRAPAAATASSSGSSAMALPPGDGTLYVTVTSNRQGKLMVESPRGFAVRGMKYEIAQPNATGVGRRTYSPLTITKEWTGASPQLHSALMNNEVLTVQIDRYRTGAGGADQLSQSVQLKQAKVTAIKHYSEGAKEVDEISFSVRDFTFTDVTANTVAQDVPSVMP